MLKIQLLVVKPNPKEDSLLFTNDKLEAFPEKNQYGLKKEMEELFSRVSEAGIHEILAYSQPVWGPDKTISELVVVDPLRFLSTKGWEKISGKAEISIKIREFIILITWLNSEHFKVETFGGGGTCIICNEVQPRRPTGQMIGGFSSDVNRPPHNREMYERLSDYCLNPDCLSHEIEKMINPDYTIPKEAFEEQEQNNRFKDLAEKLRTSTKIDLS